MLTAGTASETARAEPVAYFDVGGLVFYALLWLVTLMLLAVAAGVSARKRYITAASVFLGAFVLVVVAPFVVFATSKQKQETVVAAALKNADAEAKFCAVEAEPPLSRVNGTGPIAVNIRVVEVASSFPFRSARNPDAARTLDASAVVDELKDNWLLCFRSRVRTAYIGPSAAPISLCGSKAAPSELAAAATERATAYEVTIGEMWKESKYPEPEQWGETRMARASIRVAEHGTNRNLGMNSSSILLSGKHGRAHSCRHFVRELTEVLAAVFPV